MGTLKRPHYATCENAAVLALRAIADIELVAKRQYVPKNVQVILESFNKRLKALHARDCALDS